MASHTKDAHKKRVAVVLAGCGVYDGGEIQEAVLTLLHIELNGGTYQCFAPDMPQHHVINHLTGQESPETRNVLTEAARIARGNIQPITDINAQDYDAIILPGGFGAAKNLSNFAFKGADCQVQADTLAAIRAFADAGKPVGLMCIAPAMAGRIFGEGVQATIGNDEATADAMKATGVDHKICTVSDIVVDENRRLVTTPAYMLGPSVSDVNKGISKLVARVLEMT